MTAAELAPPVVVTPLVPYAGPRGGWDAIWLKDETAQTTGAFKFRGNLRRLAACPPAQPVVTASTGNHGQGLAAAARVYGLPATVVVPARTPRRKLDGIRRAGARAVLLEGDYAACEAAARRLAAREGGCFVSSFDEDEVIEGHRTLCDEVDRSGVEWEVALVPVGGGGLITACLRQWGGARAVEGVEAAWAPAMSRSLAAGRRVTLDAAEGIAEGLLVRTVGRIPFRECRAHAPPVRLVTAAQVREAIRALWRHNGIRAEGAGAAALAAAAAHPRPGLRCLCIVSGGNIDDADFHAVLAGSS